MTKVMCLYCGQIRPSVDKRCAGCDAGLPSLKTEKKFDSLRWKIENLAAMYGWESTYRMLGGI